MSSSYILPLLASILMFTFIYFVQEFDNMGGDSLRQIAATSASMRYQQARLLKEHSNSPVKHMTSHYSINQAEHDAIRESKEPQVFVYFSPWCSHCKHFVPLFIAWGDQYHATQLGNISTRVEVGNNITTRFPNGVLPSTTALPTDLKTPFFGTVNCIQEAEVCNKEGVEAYPTVKFRYWPNGKK